MIIGRFRAWRKCARVTGREEISKDKEGA